MSLQRRAPVLAVEAPEELHHLHDQLGPYVERRCFEQRLLGCGVEGRDLRDAVDQRLVVELRDRIPIDDIALPRRESLCFAFEARALDTCQHGFLLCLALAFGLDLATGGGDVEFAADAKAGPAIAHPVEARTEERPGGKAWVSTG